MPHSFLNSRHPVRLLERFEDILEHGEMADLFRSMEDVLPSIRTDCKPQSEASGWQTLLDPDMVGEGKALNNYVMLIERFDALSEQHPLRAAALLMRMASMIIAPLFERGELYKLTGGQLEGLIHLQLAAEALMNKYGCAGCPRAGKEGDPQ